MDNNKKRFLEILKQSRGIITSACESVDMSRQTYYNWLKDDKEFADAVDDIQEGMIDFVESKLMQKINGIEAMDHKSGEVYDLPPSDTAIIFFLKTKGKKRGYQETVVNKNVNFNTDIETEKLKDIADKLDGDY